MKNSKVEAVDAVESVETVESKDTKVKAEKKSDVETFGNVETFQLICKESSASQGWSKETKAMQIDHVGCVVQVTTQKGGSVSEALMFVPRVKIELIGGDKANGRKLVAF